MFKKIILLLIIAFIAVNASIRIKRQFGSEVSYQRRGGPSYRPSFGGNVRYGGHDNFDRGGYGRDGHHRHGGNKVIITEFVRGK